MKKKVLDITIDWQVLSTQTIYWMHGKSRFMTKKWKQKKQEYVEAFQDSYTLWITTQPIILEVIIYHWDKRKRDIDNYNKILLDAMEGIVYEDDSQIIEMTTKKFYDKERPRVHVIAYIIK